MVLNEADSGAACHRGAGTWGAAAAQAPWPRHLPFLVKCAAFGSISPSPACRRVIWGCTWSM